MDRFIQRDENGIEVEWIDPVGRLIENEDHYLVNNGYHTYRVDKLPGHTYEVIPAWS